MHSVFFLSKLITIEVSATHALNIYGPIWSFHLKQNNSIAPLSAKLPHKGSTTSHSIHIITISNCFWPFMKMLLSR